MREGGPRLIYNDKGAVAPTVALSLFALIAAGGIAFDYARVATMDTELQNAADQAALAAASQLDGKTGACTRAALAAANLVKNRTLMANDSSAASAPAIVIANEGTCDATGTIRFWQNAGKTTAATNDANAKFVEVQTSSRTAKYTLTPVVSAFTGQTIYAQAFAGLGEAICRVPPVMLCNPTEDDSAATDDVFNISAVVGKGLRLVANDGGGMTPGNFGFLDNGADGQQVLKQWLGYGSPPGDCTPTNNVETEPGVREAVISAFNTRFDMYESGQLNVIGCDPGGNCPASANSVKDLAMDMAGPNLACNAASGGSKGWKEAAGNYYSLVSSPTTPITGIPTTMGHPRDICHATSNEGDCSFTGDPNNPHSRIGNGEWDINAYWRANHGGGNYNTSTNSAIVAASGMSLPPGRTYPTRYMVYLWEMGTSATNNLPAARTTADGYSWSAAPICHAPGTRPDATTLDRRKLTVAVVNCKAHDGQTGINGKETGVQVKDWIDVFLVEPSHARAGGKTEYGDIYVEVIRSIGGGGGSNPQQIRKAVPYLIE